MDCHLAFNARTLLHYTEVSSFTYPTPRYASDYSDPASRILWHTSRNQKINFPNRNQEMIIHIPKESANISSKSFFDEWAPPGHPVVLPCVGSRSTSSCVEGGPRGLTLPPLPSWRPFPGLQSACVGVCTNQHAHPHPRTHIHTCVPACIHTQRLEACPVMS